MRIPGLGLGTRVGVVSRGSLGTLISVDVGSVNVMCL